MKRTIQIVLIAIVCFPNFAFAKTTYYGKETIKYQLNKPLQQNYEEEYRYKFYKEEKLYSDKYYVEEENDPAYPYKSNQYIQTSFTPWNMKKPEEKKDRIIRSKEIYEYVKTLPIRYLYFYDIQGSNDYLRFLELNIKYKDKNIDYEVIGEEIQNKEKIKDDDFANGFMQVKNAKTFIIDLKDFYDLEEIHLDVFLTDTFGQEASSFRISALDEQKNSLDDYVDVTFESTMYNEQENAYKFHIDMKEHIKDYYYEKEKITTEEKKIEENYRLLKSYRMYSYQDLEYKYYKIIRMYEEGYYKEKEGYKKDEDNFRIYYKIKNREKIVFKDKLEINNKKYNLYDFIESTTVSKDKIKIVDTININKNGLYKVEYSFDDFHIDQYVTVDLLDEEKIEGIAIGENSNVKSSEKISIKTGKRVEEIQKEQSKNEKQDEKNSIFSYLSISMFFIVRRILLL